MNLYEVKCTNRSAKKQRKQDPKHLRDDSGHLLTPKSDFFIREAYKTLRTNVSFSLADQEGSKVLVVTSPMQGEGKSITALNLAISYTMADHKVLLIDCDLRRPQQARLLKMSAKAGLSNLIMKPELLSEAVLHTDIQGLDVILSGDIPPNPSELLGSQRMQKLLEELRKTYDFIILDTPPVNMVTDAVVLAPRSEGVLIVVRANHSERGAVLYAADQLQYVKAKILGFVLNGVNMEDTHYGMKKYRYHKYARYGRYGYGYGGYGYSSSMPPYFAQGAEEAPQGEVR